jgi:hypothetical protein
MEFLLYLTPVGKDIYSMISKKVKVVENAPICRKYDIYGWYQATNKTLTFCTNKIKSNNNLKYDVNETLYHESAHIAQSCKNNMGWIFPLGINPSNMPLSYNKETDLNTIISTLGSKVKYIEREAFWLEDKPEKVRYYVKKFCF